ncbi:MAG TPA: hypothetical protein VNA25_02900 [Phycisphaerae bacterium]|nr:hypothetical protein [Phycisphaerae bacterium]
MSNPLALIWERADAREPRFSGDEVAGWDDGLVGRFIDAGIVRQVENATFAVCDACSDRHVEDVTFVENPRGSPVRAYIHCPQYGPVRVPLERLKQWAVDFSGFAGTIARALELAGDTEEIVPGRIWFLGKATIAAQSRELFLARGLTWEDARDVIGKSTRLNAARSAIVFAAGDVPPEEIWNGDAPPVVALKTVASFEQAGLSVDRPHIESLLSTGRKKAPVVSMSSFPTPAGTTWADVRIIIADREMSITAKGKRRDYTFIEAGFEERRKRAAPNRLWVLLKTFGMRGGVLPSKAVQGKKRDNLKQYVSDLRQRLAALLPGIEGESISYDKDEKSYRTAFRISSEQTLQFPTPEGASWTDVSIARHGSTGIRIAMIAREKFSASGYMKDEEDGEDAHQWEAAEREGTIGRTYDLRMLKLADDLDRPNRAGQALFAVLSGKGVIKREANDKGMAELCGALTKLMQIDESPFRFAKLDEKWVALFDTGDGT